MATFDPTFTGVRTPLAPRQATSTNLQYAMPNTPLASMVKAPEPAVPPGYPAPIPVMPQPDIPAPNPMPVMPRPETPTMPLYPNLPPGLSAPTAAPTPTPTPVPAPAPAPAASPYTQTTPSEHVVVGDWGPRGTNPIAPGEPVIGDWGPNGTNPPTPSGPPPQVAPGQPPTPASEFVPLAVRAYQALLGRTPSDADFNAITNYGGAGPNGGRDWRSTPVLPSSMGDLARSLVSSAEFRSRFTVANADPVTQANAWVQGYLGRGLTQADIAALTPVYQAGGMPAVQETILNSPEFAARLRAIELGPPVGM